MDVWSKGEYPASALSNFAAHAFEFDGVACASMEGLLQSFKFADPDEQREICAMQPKQAKSRGRLSAWRADQTLWWLGVPYAREGDAYQRLLDRAYAALAANPEFAAALRATGKARLTHARGPSVATETALTEAELCDRLARLRADLPRSPAGPSSRGRRLRPAERRHLRQEGAQMFKPSRTTVLGIDIGGVLVDRVAEGDDTSFFGSRPMETPAVAGSHEAVVELLELFEHRVFIVSKAGQKIAGLSRRWLGMQGLVGAHGIDPSRVHFVRRRIDKDDVCRRLGITHFVDDRLEVLEHLRTVDHRILFTGGLGPHEPPAVVPSYVTLARDWPTARARLAATC